MLNSFRKQLLGPISVAVVTLLLVVGGAFAANGLTESVDSRGDTPATGAEATSSPEPTEDASEDSEVSGFSRIADDSNDVDAAESPDASDDHSDDAAPSPDASDDHDGDDDLDDDDAAPSLEASDDDDDATETESPESSDDAHDGREDHAPESSDDHSGAD